MRPTDVAGVMRRDHTGASSERCVMYFAVFRGRLLAQSLRVSLDIDGIGSQFADPIGIHHPHFSL